jgi:O-antigen/teichoic acid export membrane protein
MPVAFSLIMIRFLYNADTVILGFFRSYDEVGSYNAAYKIILLFIALAGVYHDAIFPLISKYYMESSESLKKLLYLSQKLMSCIGIFLAVYCSIVGKNIMNLVYGNRYNNSIIAFQILIWSVLIVYLNTTYSRGLLACRKENWYMLGVAIPALLNIIINLTLIPKYGINGAAFSAVIAEISGFIIMYIGFKEICELPIVQITVKPLISSIAMALLIKASIKWFDPNIYLLTFEAIISYIIILYLIGAFTEGEIENIKSIFVKRYKY